MGRKIYDEDLRLNLILNGQGLSQGSRLMVAELGKMELKMIRLEQTAKSLAAEIKLLEKDEIGNAVRWQLPEKPIMIPPLQFVLSLLLLKNYGSKWVWPG